MFYEAGIYGWDWWWIVPLAMMAICFLMMRGGKLGCMAGMHGGHGRDAETGESPEEIAKIRYAGGEIGKEEYLRLIEELKRQ